MRAQYRYNENPVYPSRLLSRNAGEPGARMQGREFAPVLTYGVGVIPTQRQREISY